MFYFGYPILDGLQTSISRESKEGYQEFTPNEANASMSEMGMNM
jgi:hypothetical protein